MIVNDQILVSDFLNLLDLVGTFAFAISGAVSGIKHKLDLFGVLVLSFVAATAGGITRDVLIGAIPPASVADWRYITVSILAGLAVFFWYPLTTKLKSPVQLFDAIGLGLFAVVGAGKALAFHVAPGGAVLLGVMTGVGGGVVRDVLVAEVPIVFTAELYAVAALLGSIVVVLGHALSLPSAPAEAVGGFLCVALRLLAIRNGWRLPVAQHPD
ncbi:MAG TPA: TRIC cation channel family protein [Acidisarcina sp.]|nr:TRIC cation channel family protein [Acidisarcina sp.]